MPMKLARAAALLAASSTLLAACGSSDDTPPQITVGTSAKLALLETTDLHQNILGYDHYKLKDDPSVGLDRTATLIAAARAQNANTMLFDAGDVIQGTVLGDYQAVVSKLPCTDKLAIFKAMDQLGFDAGAIGNHEFNYGLAYLGQVTAHGANRRHGGSGTGAALARARCASRRARGDAPCRLAHAAACGRAGPGERSSGVAASRCRSGRRRSDVPAGQCVARRAGR